jgi:hypothetical protein
MKFCLQLQNLSMSYVPSFLVKQGNDSIVLLNDYLKYYFALYFEIIKLLCGSTCLQNVNTQNLSKEKNVIASKSYKVSYPKFHI